MRLLFITRKYPPMVGGMEKLSYALAKEFSARVDTNLITWGGSQKYLPIILPYFFLKALYLIPAKRIDHVHIGDGLLSPLGLVLKKLFGIKTTITIAGLDITFNFPGYQLIIPKCVAALDKIICISQATLDECVMRGVPKYKCAVIPCGVYPEEWITKSGRKDLEKLVGKDLGDKKVIITVGRLVKRKGVYWFIENVLPKLDKNSIYAVIGDGPEKERINELVQKLHIQDRVVLLGKLSDQDLKIVYNTSDLFIMPNLSIKNTMEGFGIVAIEASSTGLPVIASDIEGIRAAIINDKNGYLVPSEDIDIWIRRIHEVLYEKKLHKSQILKWTREHYSWSDICSRYIKEFIK